MLQRYFDERLESGGTREQIEQLGAAEAVAAFENYLQIAGQGGRVAGYAKNSRHNAVTQLLRHVYRHAAAWRVNDNGGLVPMRQNPV